MSEDIEGGQCFRKKCNKDNLRLEMQLNFALRNGAPQSTNNKARISTSFDRTILVCFNRTTSRKTRVWQNSKWVMFFQKMPLISNILAYMRCLLRVQFSPDSFNYSLTSVSSTSQGLVEKTQSHYSSHNLYLLMSCGLLSRSQMPCQMILEVYIFTL